MAHKQAQQATTPSDRATEIAPSRSSSYFDRWSPLLWFCLLVAAALRIWLVARSQGLLDGDEALVGIQAERILQGHFPVYFYGIPYFGSLEAYLTSLVFTLFSPSVWGMRAEAIILALVLVWLNWKCAASLAEAARLIPSMQRIFMAVTTLAAAVPPLYDGLMELRNWGGWIETYVLMLLLLISTLRLTQRWRSGASRWELTLRWAGIGVIVGVGFWVYPLIICAVFCSSLWIMGFCGLAIWRRRKTDKPGPVLKQLWLAVTVLPGAALGFAPALFWGVSNNWANIGYILAQGGAGGMSGQRLATIRAVTRSYLTCITPRIISGSIPHEDQISQLLYQPLLIFGSICMSVVVLLFGLSFVYRQQALLSIRTLAGLPLLFAAGSALIFCVSSSSAFALIGCDFDDAGRYATPLMLAIPFFIATTFTASWMFLQYLAQRQTPAALQRGSGGNVARLLQGLLVLVLLGYLGGQVTTYGTVDAGHTFQSNYCPQDPADNTPILDYMQREHIHYFWANNMLAYPLVFKTNSAIIGVDPLPLQHPDIAINRIPVYTDAVLHADHASFLVVIHHNEAAPRLLQALDSLQVTYRKAIFPSQSGFDVLVVTPINRTVSPLESPTLDLFYCVSPQ